MSLQSVRGSLQHHQKAGYLRSSVDKVAVEDIDVIWGRQTANVEYMQNVFSNKFIVRKKKCSVYDNERLILHL